MGKFPLQQPQSLGRAVEAATVVVAPVPMLRPAHAPLQLQLQVHVLPVRGHGERLSRVPICVPSGKENLGCVAAPAPQLVPGLRA